MFSLPTRPPQSLTGMRSISPRRRPDEYARLWRVLDALHVHLSESRTVTQRGLYYLLSSSDKDLFPNPGVVNTCLRECVGLLRCSRHAMGITTSSRGQVAGRLHVRGPDGVWKDCAAPGGGYYVIPGDVGILRRVELRCDARYVIIVEKDSVFDKLVRERVFDRLPCVIVTAKGFPDLATRAFLRRIQDSFPVLPILAFVDWNPSGILILQTYRSTSRSAALEASRYALDVKWLGIRSGDLGELSSASRLPLTDLDRAKIRNLLLAAGVSADDIERGGGGGGSSGSFQTTFDLGEGDLGESERRRRVLISELRDMLNSGTKAEIESLYPVAAERGEFFLAEFIIEKILRADYV